MRIDRGGISCWGNLCMISPLWGAMGVITLPTVLNEPAGFLVVADRTRWLAGMVVVPRGLERTKHGLKESPFTTDGCALTSLVYLYSSNPPYALYY